MKLTKREHEMVKELLAPGDSVEEWLEDTIKDLSEDQIRRMIKFVHAYDRLCKKYGITVVGEHCTSSPALIFKEDEDFGFTSDDLMWNYCIPSGGSDDDEA